MSQSVGRWVFASVYPLLVGLVAGCGSRDSSGTLGSLAFSVEWPEVQAAGLLPRGAQSVRVTLEDRNGRPLRPSQTITRPPKVGSERVVFRDLRPGQIIVEVTAHNKLDASDPPLSVGSAVESIVAGRQTRIVVSMNSTVAAVELNPCDLGPDATQPCTVILDPGESRQMTATARDAQGRLLLGASFGWVSEDPNTVQVETTGLATAKVSLLKAGGATVTVSEEASGKTAPLLVTVGGVGFGTTRKTVTARS